MPQNKVDVAQLRRRDRDVTSRAASTSDTWPEVVAIRKWQEWRYELRSIHTLLDTAIEELYRLTADVRRIEKGHEVADNFMRLIGVEVPYSLTCLHRRLTRLATTSWKESEEKDAGCV